jgi:AraC-like DNA-binding protein
MPNSAALRTYVPLPPLSYFVEKFWYYETYAPLTSRERILPTGTMQLVFSLRDEKMQLLDRHDPDQVVDIRGPLLLGMQSEFCIIDTSRPETILGVQFKPGGTVPFLKCAADELQDAQIALEDLWGARAGELDDRLRNAQTISSCFRILEQFLLARVVRPLKHHPAVTRALHEFEAKPIDRTIADIAAQVGLSPRRFIQLFRQEVGLTPKLYCRVQRFQKVVRFIGNQQSVDWTMLALVCGYYDQSHFINDFRAFSGVSPSTYMTIKTEHLYHLPLAD